MATLDPTVIGYLRTAHQALSTARHALNLTLNESYTLRTLPAGPKRPAILVGPASTVALLQATHRRVGTDQRTIEALLSSFGYSP